MSSRTRARPKPSAASTPAVVSSPILAPAPDLLTAAREVLAAQEEAAKDPRIQGCTVAQAHAFHRLKAAVEVAASMRIMHYGTEGVGKTPAPSPRLVFDTEAEAGPDLDAIYAKIYARFEKRGRCGVPPTRLTLAQIVRLMEPVDTGIRRKPTVGCMGIADDTLCEFCRKPMEREPLSAWRFEAEPIGVRVVVPQQCPCGRLAVPRSAIL